MVETKQRRGGREVLKNTGEIEISPVFVLMNENFTLYFKAVGPAFWSCRHPSEEIFTGIYERKNVSQGRLKFRDGLSIALGILFDFLGDIVIHAGKIERYVRLSADAKVHQADSFIFSYLTSRS